jgi:hypothetical protein
MPGRDMVPVSIRWTILGKASLHFTVRQLSGPWGPPPSAPCSGGKRVPARIYHKIGIKARYEKAAQCNEELKPGRLRGRDSPENQFPKGPQIFVAVGELQQP